MFMFNLKIIIAQSIYEGNLFYELYCCFLQAYTKKKWMLDWWLIYKNFWKKGVSGRNLFGSIMIKMICEWNKIQDPKLYNSHVLSLNFNILSTY